MKLADCRMWPDSAKTRPTKAIYSVVAETSLRLDMAAISASEAKVQFVPRSRRL